MTTPRIALLPLILCPAAGAEPHYLCAEPPDTPHPFQSTTTWTRIAFAAGLQRAALTLMDVGADGKVAAVIHEARRTSGERSSPARVASLADHPGGEVALSAHGRWRIWASARAGGLGRTDLCFSRLDHAGNWTPARNLTVRED